MAVTKRGKKYGYDFYYEGERYRGHKWEERRDAEDAEEDLKFELKKGINTTHGLTFTDYFETWKDVKTTGLSANTIRNYDYTLKYINIYFKKRKLKEIKRIEYQKFINWFGLEAENKRTKKKGMSKENVEKVHGHISNAIRDAEYEGLITKDFTYNIELNFTDNAKKEEDKFVSLSEFKGIKRKAKLDDTLESVALYLASFTAARHSDLIRMKYDDINLINSTIHLPGTKNEHADRVLKVSERDIRTLQRKIDALPRNISGYIFQRGSSFLSNETVNKRLNYLTRSFIDRPITIYVLRHTLGSIFLSDGLSEDFVYKFLGHASADQLRKTYRHHLPEKQNMEENLSKKISAKL